jgi:formylglycine-generating enzyme required for sulfatase activity
VQPESGRFEAPATDRDGDVWQPDWPIMMVSRHDAEAYCAWASARDGARIRLPTAQEWEVAARGVDERIYPWGNGFDATLTKVVDSPGPRGAESVCSRPRDRSPFDVYDMAGLVSEWTSTPDGEHPDGGVLKGAGYRSQSIWCRAASRVIQRVSFTGVQFGFRVVREPG